MKGSFDPVDDKKIYAVSGRVLNALYKLARQWDNLTVEGGKLTKSDRNALLTIEEVNGIPEGYVETAVTLCQNGAPVTGTILFKPDTVEE